MLTEHGIVVKQNKEYAMSIRRSLFLAGVLILVVVAVACGGGSSSGGTAGHEMGDGSVMSDSTIASPTTSPGGMTGSPRASDDPDLGFIDGMIIHHQSAIDMAKVAQEQGEHQEIKELANAII